MGILPPKMYVTRKKRKTVTAIVVQRYSCCDGVYDIASSMLTWPAGMVLFFSAGDIALCTGPSTVDVFALGMETLLGDWAELDRAGVGGASLDSFDSRGMVGESTRS
jgi:hypothetical protein